MHVLPVGGLEAADNEYAGDDQDDEAVLEAVPVELPVIEAPPPGA